MARVSTAGLALLLALTAGCSDTHQPSQVGSTLVQSAAHGPAPSVVNPNPRLEPSISAFAHLGVPLHAIVDHRFSRPVTIDGGALTIEPPGSKSARVSLSDAERLVMVAMVNQEAQFNPELVAIGRVSVSAPGPGDVPRYRDRLAWVGFIDPNAGPVSCLGGASGPGYTDAPSFVVVVSDASSGKAALTYRSRGTGPCGGPLVGPSINRAYEVLSVPWTVRGQESVPLPPTPPGFTFPTHAKEWVIQYTMPPCGSNWDSAMTYRGRTPAGWYVEVQRPIELPTSCRPPRKVTGSLPTDAPLLHAPTGLVVDNTTTGGGSL